MDPTPVDLAIIGGGVNGCGIARDAAGRGLSVLLVERGDLSGGTSSASTKLVHGGLRYLESLEFRLVRESLHERRILRRIAPHIVRPLRFILPCQKDGRPEFMIRAGLWLYDRLDGHRDLPPTRSLDLRHDEAGTPLQPGYRRGYEYSDCWVDDARLVVLNALDAAGHGARIHTRTELMTATPTGDHWQLQFRDLRSGRTDQASARILVNATGPWIGEVIRDRLHRPEPRQTRLVRGSHIVLPRLFDHDRAYIFQNPDRRILFALPYERDFTLIGTTESEFTGDPAAATADPAEIAYLCDMASRHFARPVRPEEVTATFSGVRPLHEKADVPAREASRGYTLEHETVGEAALLHVFGGKITTYRQLAETALDRLAGLLPQTGGAWTADTPLPGGDLPEGGLPALVDELQNASVDPPLALRLAQAYGTRAREIAAALTGPTGPGQCFGAGFHEREAEYLVQHEWAETAEDILWRRTKLGLHMDEAGRGRLQEWMQHRSA